MKCINRLSFQHAKDRRGFTLIEAIVTITIASILAFTVGSFIVSSIQAWVLISQRNAGVNNARSGMNRMVSEIRCINTTNGITFFTTSECRFTDIINQSVDFTQEGTTLTRNGATLETGLTTPAGLVFTYLDENGNRTWVKTNIRSVRIWLSLASATQLVTLESSARIRNPW